MGAVDAVFHGLLLLHTRRDHQRWFHRVAKLMQESASIPHRSWADDSWADEVCTKRKKSSRSDNDDPGSDFHQCGCRSSVTAPCSNDNERAGNATP